MLLSMRKTFLIVMIVLALLFAGLSSLSAHMVSMPTMYQHTGIFSSHMPTGGGGGKWYCPPPPRGC